MTEDAQVIRDALDWYLGLVPDKTERAIVLADRMVHDERFRAAVARHLIATDPEAVRIPLKGTVS